MNFSRVLFFGLLLSLVTFAEMNVTIDKGTYPNGTILIQGSTGVAANVTALVSGQTLNVSNTTNSNGQFNITLNVTLSEGFYNITVSNNATSDTALLPITVSQIFNASFTVLGSPTYATGTTFRVNLTSLNYSSSALQSHTRPVVKVYKPMSGLDSTFTVSNNTATTDSSGRVTYSVTVPNSATGAYALVVEDAVNFQHFIFNIKPGDDGLFFTITPKTNESVESQVFALNQNVTLEAKFRYGNGTMVGGATIVARVILPDTSSSSLTFTETSTTGVYEANFTNVSLTGQYNIAGKATYSGSNYFTNTQFTAGSVTVEISPNTDVFFKEEEGGGKLALKPGTSAQFLVKIKNLTSGEYVTSSLNGGSGAVNCSNVSLYRVINTSDSKVASITDFTMSTITSFGGTYCLATFTAPNKAGTYKIIVNATQYNASGDGFFLLQSYLLVVTPQQDLTGTGDTKFQQMFSPGANATFKLTAKNSTGESVTSITNIGVVKLFNLPTGTELSASQLTYTIDETNDIITLTMPNSPTDAFVLTVNATVTQGSDAENVNGNTFFFSKYIIGFMMPASNGGGQQQEGGPGQMQQESKCSGTEAFRGSVMLASTGEQISNVWLNETPQLVMEESTGKIVTSCISFIKNVSSSGVLLTNATFNSSCTFSGRYFFLGNVTYTDTSGAHTDSLPGSFRCVNLKGFVSFRPAQSNQFSVSSTGRINVTVSNVKYLNGTTVSGGYAQVTALRAFAGFGMPKSVAPSSSLNFSLSNGSASFQLYPENFSTSGGGSNTQWSNGEGFVMGEVRVCDASGSTCSTFESGIPIGSSTELWTFSQSNSFTIAQNVSVTVYAKANLSSSFVAKFEKFGVGNPLNATVYATKTQDTWNANGDSGQEVWQLNITVPSGLTKGDARISLTATNSATSEKVRRDIFGSVAGASLTIPEAGIQFYTNSSQVGTLATSGLNQTLVNEGWNVSWLNETYGFSIVPSSQICFIPNATVMTFGSGGANALVNGSIKLLGIDADNDGTHDTIIARDTTILGNSTNTSAITVANSINRTIITGKLYFWQMFGCGFTKVAYTSSTSAGSNLGQYGVSQNISIPYLVARGSEPISGVTVNISAVYTQQDEGWGIGSQLPSSSYTVYPAVTDVSGIAWVKINITTSGRYRLLWKINGSVNDTANSNTATGVEVRSMVTTSSILNEFGNGIQMINLSNSTAGAGNLTCSAGGCTDIFNGTASSLYGMGELSVAFNSSNNRLIVNVGGTNTTCNGSSLCETNSTAYQFSQRTFGLAAANLTPTTTKQLAFYLKTPNKGGQAFVTSTSNVSVEVCGYQVTVSSTNQNPPLSNANVTAIFLKEFNFNGPPTTTVLAMYDPITNNSVSSIQLSPNGCTAFRTNKSSGTWPFNGEIRANITALINGQLVTEGFHVANINRQ